MQPIQDDSSCDVDIDDNEDDDEKGCCNDGACDCVCCGHIFTTKTVSKISIQYPKSDFKHIYTYQNNYLYKGVNAIWQPPQNA